MRKLTVLLAVVTAISGCDKLETTLGYGSAGRFPRFQMTSNSSDVFLYDTVTGKVWKHKDKDEAFLEIEVVDATLDYKTIYGGNRKEMAWRNERIKKEALGEQLSTEEGRLKLLEEWQKETAEYDKNVKPTIEAMYGKVN